MTTTEIAADTVRRYLDAWNATDPAQRRAAVRTAFADDARYVDPLADVTGHDALDALIAGVQARFGGMVFAPSGESDAHHDVVRFTWTLGPAGAEPPIVGFDIARIAPDGRIAFVAGFLDRVPTG